MPLNQHQSSTLSGIVEELQFLKKFIDENQLSLFDLIGSEKSTELLNKTEKLQKIFEDSDDLRVRKTILNLFQVDKIQPYLKKLDEIQKDFEKTIETKKLSFINDYKKKQTIDEVIKYIYLRILYRKDSVNSLAKYKSLINIIDLNDKSKYIELLTSKLVDQGKSGQILFIHLNNLYDKNIEKELKLLERINTKKVQFKQSQSNDAELVQPANVQSDRLTIKINDPISKNAHDTKKTEIQSVSIAPIDSTNSQTDLTNLMTQASSNQIERSKSKVKSPNVVNQLFDELIEKKQYINDLIHKITTLEIEIDQLKKQTIEKIPQTSVKEGLNKIKLSIENRQNTTKDESIAKLTNQIKEVETLLNQAKLDLTQSEKSIDKYKNKSENLKQQLTEQQNTSKQLEQELTDADQEKQKLEQRIDQLQKSLDTSEKNKEDFPTELNQAKAELTQLTQIFNNSNDEILKLKRQTEATQIELNRVKKDLFQSQQSFNQSNIEVERLRQQLENQQKVSKEFEIHYQAQLVEYEALKNKADRKVEELQKSLAEIQEKNSHDESENFSLKESLVNLESKLNEKNNLLSLTEQQISDLKDELTNLQANFTSTVSELNSQLNQKREEKKDVKFEEIIKECALFISQAEKILYDIPYDPAISFSSTQLLTENFKQILKNITIFKEKATENEKLQQEISKQEIAHTDLNNDKQQLIFEITGLKQKIRDLESVAKTLNYTNLENKKSTDKNHLDDTFENNLSIDDFLNEEISPFDVDQNHQKNNKNYLEAEYNFDMDSDEQNFNDENDNDPVGDDPNKEIDPLAFFARNYQELESTKALLAEKESELQHKSDDLAQLKKEFGIHTEKSISKQKILEEQIAAQQESSYADQQNILSLKSENESLERELNNVQKSKKDIEEKISLLQDELKTNESTNQNNLSLLSQRLNEFEDSNSHYENQIKTLQQLINEKNTNIKELADQMQQKNDDLQEIQNKLSTELTNKQKELNKLISELRSKNQTIVQLKNDLEKTKNKLPALTEELQDLKTELETTNFNLSKAYKTLEESEKFSDNRADELQKNYNDLQKKYDTLEQELQDKATEKNDLSNKIKKIQHQLETKQLEIESLKKVKQSSKNKIQTLEEQLLELKKEDSMPEEHMPLNEEIYVKPSSINLNQDSKSITSPKHELGSNPSLASLDSPTPSSSAENLSNFSNSLEDVSNKSHENSSDNLNNTHTEISNESEEDQSLSDAESLDPRRNFIPENVSNITIPNQKNQIDDLVELEFKNQFGNALETQLKKDYETEFTAMLSGLVNAPLFPESELNKLKKSVEETVYNLFNNVKSSLEIKRFLNQFYLLNEDENSAEKFLDLFKLNTLVDVGEYPHCNSKIQKTLNENIVNAKEYAKLLNELENQCLSPEAKKSFRQTIQANLAKAFKGISENDKLEIANVASQLIDKTLIQENVLIALERAKTNGLLINSDLIAATKEILAKQCNMEIKKHMENHYADIIMDNILDKIKNKKNLSDIEIQAIPSELQYVNSEKEFIYGLRLKFHLSDDFENKLDEASFKDLRLLLRKKSLTDINKIFPENKEIIDLDATAWLEEKLKIITNKSVSLEQIKLEKEQNNLLKELNATLQDSILYDIAITPKSITELTKEIEKSNQIQLTVVDQINKIFSEIEIKQINYPNLLDNTDIPGFTANLNQHLENNSISLQINNVQAKILLEGINRRLKKDISKWNLLSHSFQKEIANDILSNLEGSNFDLDELNTEKLVTHALSVLRGNYANDALKKRELWLKDIALLYATTQELCHFSQKIEINRTKFEDLLALKKADASNQEESKTKNKIPSAVYLPHSCAIVADSFNPTLSEELSKTSDFKILDGAFYKQDALQPNQMLTFSQTLRNGQEQKWSVTRVNETCLAYKIHTPWLNIVNNIKDGIGNTMAYVRSNNAKELSGHEEVMFTQLTHAVNSSSSSICTITIGKNCSREKEKFIRLVVNKFNQQQHQSGKKTILMNANDKLKMHSVDKATTYDKINKAQSFSENINNQVKQANEIVKSHGLGR